MKNFLKIQKLPILGRKLKRYVAVDVKVWLSTFDKINTNANFGN